MCAYIMPPPSFIDKIEHNPIGKSIVSVILGLGLASLFRKTCKEGSCIIIRGPKQEELNKYVYKIDNDCYKYTPRVARCQVGGS